MGRPRKADDGIIKYEARCKVCNSHFKNMIEALYVNNLNPRQIFEALNSLTDTASQKILQQEQLTESAIARHLDRHFSIKAGAALQQAKTQDRIQKSRELFKDGVQNKINTISTLSHLIDVALINIESLDSLPDGRQRHQLTINYMGQIKSLIDEFSKLTGELQVENTFDINFWNIQISEFANIVMQVIRHMDHKFQLNSQLEYNFGIEFQKQWKQYRETQTKILNGELPADYGAKERSLNTFNVTPKYDNDTTSEELIDGETLTINNINNNHLLSTDNSQIDNINSEIEEDLSPEQNKPFNSLRQDYSEQYITDNDDNGNDDGNNGNEYNKENFNSTLDQDLQQNNSTSQSKGDPYFLNNYYSSYLTEDNEIESEEEKNYNDLHKQYTEQAFNNNVIDNQLQADSYLQDAMKKSINANQILSTDQYADDYDISFPQQGQENNYFGDTFNGNFGNNNDNNYGNNTSNNNDVVKNNLSKMAAVQRLLRKRNQLQNSYLTDLNQSNANNNANKDFTNTESTSVKSTNENENQNENDQESILIKSKRKVPDDFKPPKSNKELTKQLHNFFRK